MNQMVLDEKTIKLLKEYNLRVVKPNPNEIYLQSSVSEENKKTIGKYSCIDCNQFPLVAYKCNDQICQKLLCSKCLQIRKEAMNETHDELDLSEVYDCMDCHSLKFSKYDLEKEEDLQNLKFLCPNKNLQIIEELRYADVKKHIENCEFLKLCKCIQCGTTGSETDLITHIKECPEAIILCEYCEEETERKFYNIHLLNCERINQEINLDSSVNEIEEDENNLKQRIECEYVTLTENKIDNLSNNEFAVSSEKEENISTSKKSEINNNCNSQAANEIKNQQISFECEKLFQENAQLKEKLDELESKLSLSNSSCAEENAKIMEKLAMLEKQIGNLNKDSRENSSKGSDWKRVICSFLLFGMFIQQLVILYLIKSKYTNVQLKRDFDSFEIYRNQRMNLEDIKIGKNQAFQEELEKQRQAEEKIKVEKQRRLNLITKKSGNLEKFFTEKNLKFSAINKLFEKKLNNMEKIYNASKLDLDADFVKETEKFKLTIKDTKNLIYFLNLKIKEKKLSIGFFHSIQFTQKDLKSYKFHKDENSFLMFSGNKFLFAKAGQEAQFFFLDNYFFIIGFNNGGGFYLRNKTLSLNSSKLANQFKVSKEDFDFLEELNGKNLYEHLDSLQVYKINSEIEEN